MSPVIQLYTKFFRYTSLALFVVWIFFGFDVIAHFKGDKCRVSLVLSKNEEATEEYYNVTVWLFLTSVFLFTFGKFAQSEKSRMIGTLLFSMSGVVAVLVGWQIAMGSFTGQCKDSPQAAYLNKIDGIEWFTGITLAYLISVAIANSGHLFTDPQQEDSVFAALKNPTVPDNIIRLSQWSVKLAFTITVSMMILTKDSADFRNEFLKGVIGNGTIDAEGLASNASCLNVDRGNNTAFEEAFDLDGDDSYKTVRALFIVAFAALMTEFVSWGARVMVRENEDMMAWINMAAKWCAFLSDFFLSFVIIGLMTTNDRPDCEVYDMENTTVRASMVFAVLYMFSWIARPSVQFYFDAMDEDTGDYLGLSRGLMS